jgi:amino acid efflux transporter
LLVGLTINYFGVKITGQLQTIVVLVTLIVLVVTIAGSLHKIEVKHFEPFMPAGWSSVGFSLTVLFWCFIGWEAVSNMSKEFLNPRRDAIKGTLIAAAVIGIVYFLAALVVVGTRSYGSNMTEASLIYVIKSVFGAYGAIIAGFAALFICMAPAIAYIGAASRLACSLAENGYAPGPLAHRSARKTPSGGLIFLAFCFIILLIVFGTRIVSLTTLIQIPNATFILTYIGGCAAGIVLLKDTKFGIVISIISLILSIFVFIFVKWTVLYPVMITLLWLIFLLISKKFRKVKEKTK